MNDLDLENIAIDAQLKRDAYALACLIYDMYKEEDEAKTSENT